MNLLGNMQLAGLRTSQKLQMHTPEIALGLGVVGIIGSTIHACYKSVTEVRDEVDKITLDRLAIEDDVKDNAITKEEATKQVRTVYLKGCMKIAGIYMVDALTMGVSILCIKRFVYTELNNRLNRSAAAYAQLLATLNQCREWVRENYGEDAEYNMLHGVRQESIEVDEVDEKTGKTKKKKKKVDVATAEESLYMRYFTKSNPEWKSTDELNTFFFGCMERIADDKLRRMGNGGFITLNEVYNMLNFKETPMGMVVGWRYDKDNPTGDNYVNFKWHKVYLPDEHGNYEEAWAIDFNVDGNIYKEMSEMDLNTPLSGDILRDAMQFPQLVASKMKKGRE